MTSGPRSLPVFGSIGVFAWAIFLSSSCVASRWTILSVTSPSLTTRYGVVTKPCSEISRVGRQRADQADVRTLGGLDRAHAAVVGRVHVANLDRCALAGQAAGAERDSRRRWVSPDEGVGLVHELRQLRGAEELLHRGDDRPDVDDRLRRDRVRVLGREPLAHRRAPSGRGRSGMPPGSARRPCAAGGCRSARTRRGARRPARADSCKPRRRSP